MITSDVMKKNTYSPNHPPAKHPPAKENVCYFNNGKKALPLFRVKRCVIVVIPLTESILKASYREVLLVEQGVNPNNNIFLL